MPDVAFVNMRYASGTIAQIELAWLAPSKLRRTAIVGSERMVVYDDTSGEPVRVFGGGPSSARRVEPWSSAQLGLEVVHSFEAVESSFERVGSPRRSTPRSGRRRRLSADEVIGGIRDRFDVESNVHERRPKRSAEAPRPDRPSRRLILIGPLPPPVMDRRPTALVLENADLQRKFDVEHLDTTDRRSIENMGRWDIENIGLAITALCALCSKSAALVTERCTYRYRRIAAGSYGLALILIARARGWTAAAHIRNCLFRDFYSCQPRIFRWWIRFTMRRISGVAVLGETLKYLMEGFVDERRVAVVPNGTPGFARPEVELRIGILVLYLSNIARKKGAEHAVATALLVAHQMPRARFVFAGGWESSALETEIRQLADPLATASLFRLVYGEEKAQLMAQARVLLFPLHTAKDIHGSSSSRWPQGFRIVTTDRATIRQSSIVDGESGSSWMIPFLTTWLPHSSPCSKTTIFTLGSARLPELVT